MTPMVSSPACPLAGAITVPGDKSISHRALILGASAMGVSRIRGLLEAEDVLATLAAIRRLGVKVEAAGSEWQVHGPGVGGLAEPTGALDLGNSGTGVRLLAGLVATHSFVSFFIGDDSLSARPMKRVMDPLDQIGASFWTRSGGRLPMAVRGAADPLPITYRLPVASAQVKSAVLLAGLNVPGTTTVIEPQPTRDHTERMLRHFGAEIEVEDIDAGGRRISLAGQQELLGRDLVVPGDLSSAAFPLVAALVCPGSRLTLRNIGINPLRTGLLTTLREMGARLSLTNERQAGLEPVADIVVESGPLRGVSVPARRVPAMIDEFPILAVAAAYAEGVTRMTGIGELRVKESDRLSAMARGLTACGIVVEEGEDWLDIVGAQGSPPLGGAKVPTGMDHRMAMAFLVFGCASQRPVEVDDAGPIGTSFPGFADLMNGIGARIENAQ
ncbi:MAG: 3-phosphoshikimate 1-carboxyvinyltransferase [Rhodospirillales bacterium]|nr:3-phosphoshikimate 1-carboxyvinyltransferase [Rhodospirillales bacterium]